MKKYIIITLALGWMASASGQQLQTSAMYELQGILHNPSLAGTNKYDMVGASYRQQWSSFSGSPKTATIFGSFAFPKQEIGLSGYVYSDKTGPTSRTGLQLAMAKHINTGNGGKISFGIEARFMQFALDKNKLSASLGADPVLGAADNRFKFDAGAGISYTSDKIQLGASASQLVQSRLDIYSGNLTRSEESRLYRHYYFHGKYNWRTDGDAVIVPNFLVIYLPNAPTEVQVGARVEHKEIFWYGLAYRWKQSYILSAGVNINKKFTIGYSYDDYVTPLAIFTNGVKGHEVLLRYNFIK